MRRSFTLVRVAQDLMQDPFGIHWGYTISQNTGLLTGSVYPTLHRMEKVGWVTVEWESAPDGVSLGHPPRRIYKVTADGRKAMKKLLPVAACEPRFAVLFA